MDRHMRAVDLAERWSCSTGWLANLRMQNEGPKYLKIGASVIYRQSDVEAYEAARVVVPA